MTTLAPPDAPVSIPGPFSTFHARTNTTHRMVLPVPSHDADEHAHDARRGARACASVWTGAPIRAIVPLPRRHVHADTQVQAQAQVQRRVSVSVSVTDAHDADCTDSDAGDEDKDESEEEDGDDEGARYCSYESITAACGLSAWSFEELRAECYAQCQIARGATPSPVVQPSLAIPPAFVPRIVRLPKTSIPFTLN